MLESEFDLIERYFAPLTAGVEGAYGLTDDAATLAERSYVVSKDILIAGVHFLAGDPMDRIARKALRVNLSDLAAKGAKPVGYFLGLALPRSIDVRQIAAFAEGLQLDQQEFKLSLYGGDTTVHAAPSAPFVISVTIFGSASKSGVVLRSGAAAGDDVYVTGTIGDGGLGLKAAQKPKGFPADDRAYLIDRYQLPRPRLGIGSALGGLASASIDVSDGLIADLGHIAKQSGVQIELLLERAPLSAAAVQWVDRQPDRADALLSLANAGDDYEIAFTGPSSRRRAIELASQLTKTPVTRIGSVVRGAGVTLVDDDGKRSMAPNKGYDHFAERSKMA